MDNRVLVVDIDATIWDSWPPIRDAVRDITGVELSYEGQKTWGLGDQVGEENLEAIFKKALNPREVMRRRFYPGCLETLRMMHRTYGITLHFVSHNNDPHPMRAPVSNWLRRSLGFEEYQVVIEDEGLDKVQYALDHNAFGIIDDKPSTLLDAYYYMPHDPLIATKEHPWVEDVVARTNGYIRPFHSWFQVNGMIAARFREEIA